MAKDEALKRLGGGRWETKDGRFQIEPQSGTWVIVDTTQTDDFGLPLVRGPFGSLTAAREAIETARGEEPVESPLAERMERSKEWKESKAASPKSTVAKKTTAREPEPEPEEEPKPPPEPKWIRELGTTDRRKAKALIERLEGLEIEDGEEIARAEIARREPALAREALERQLRAAIRSARTPHAAAKAAIEIILAGKDDDLSAEWHLTDGQGRPIDSIDVE
jgi:hypothetical protein